MAEFYHQKVDVEESNLEDAKQATDNRQADDEKERPLKRSHPEIGIKQGNRRRKEKKRLPQCIPTCTQKTTSVGATDDGFHFRVDTC